MREENDVTASAETVPKIERDSNEAISLAIEEGDFSFVSDSLRAKLDAWLRLQVGRATAGPCHLADDAFFESVKIRGRERRQAAQHL